VTGAAKAKGDHAEREFCAKTSDLLGVELRRKLGAGRFGLGVLFVVIAIVRRKGK